MNGNSVACEVCGAHPANGVTTYRTTPVGTIGPWRCQAHLTAEQQPPAGVSRIVGMIESAGKVKQ